MNWAIHKVWNSEVPGNETDVFFGGWAWLQEGHSAIVAGSGEGGRFTLAVCCHSG